MLTGLLASTATFRQDFRFKASFVLLNQFDLVLTLIAMFFGLYELNPIMRSVLATPTMLLLMKMVIPVLIAWLIPGKLLVPAIALLAFIVGWDIKELIIYFM